MTAITTSTAPLHQISGPAEALRRLAASRDSDAWAWLCAELGPQLRRMTGRLSVDAPSADDALQETLLTVRDHAAQFRPRLDPDADARHWLLRVAANAALGLARRQRRAEARATRALAPVGESLSSSAPIERQELSHQVRLALAALGERERTAIVLRVLEDLEYRDIATTMGCAEGTVKSLVSRGLGRLRAGLGAADLSLLTIGLALPASPGASPSASSLAGLLHSQAAATLSCVPRDAALSGAITGVLTAAALLGAAALLTIVTEHAWAGHHATPVEPTASAPVAVTSGVSMTPPAQQPGAGPASDPLLQRTMSVAFTDTSVGDVASFLRTITGLPIAVDPLVQNTIATSVQVDHMTLLNLLRWTLVRRHLRVRFAQHGLTIGPLAQPPAAAAADDITLGPEGQPLSAAPPAVRDHLAQQISVSFQATQLADVVRFLTQISSLTVIIDPDLDAGSIGNTTLAFTHTPVEQVLAQACALHGLIATWADGAVLISRASGTPALPQAAQ